MNIGPTLASTVVGSALLVAAAPAPSPVVAGDAVHGRILFLQCKACHTVTPGAPNAVGPNLAGIVGAKAATRPGYTYSPALAAAGIVWDATSLDAFIKRPTQKVPGTKMTFAGVADPKSRADIIAYLATLKAK